MTDVDKDLAGALVSASAHFAAAETDEEQTDQRAIIAVIVDGVLRRHQFLTAKVKEAKQNERYGV